MNNLNKHVVFGANGPLGRAVVEVLHNNGLHVRAVSRSGGGKHAPGIETAAADAMNAEAVKGVCADAAVIYHCMNTPYSTWGKTLVPIMNGLLEGARHSGAKLVYGDNLYTYAPQADGHYHEELPWKPTTKKGHIRAHLLNLIQKASQDGGFPFTVGMASDFYGPHVTENGHLGSLVIGRALQGKSAQIVADPDQPHTFTYIRDMAEDLVTLALDSRADGKTWHVRNAPAQTFREVIALISRIIDREIKVQPMPRALLNIMGWFNKDIAEIREMLYQFQQPFIISDDRFRMTFGGEATALEVGLRDTIDWYKQREGV